jgi:hypothetical protein
MTADIWIRDYNPPRRFQKKISGRAKHHERIDEVDNKHSRWIAIKRWVCKWLERRRQHVWLDPDEFQSNDQFADEWNGDSLDLDELQSNDELADNWNRDYG